MGNNLPLRIRQLQRRHQAQIHYTHYKENNEGEKNKGEKKK